MVNLPEIVKENQAALDRLEKVVRGFSEAQLTTSMPAGWTVSAVLAHLAFWDLRASALLDKWAADGIGPSPIDIDLVNEATRNLCLAIAPQEAIALCLSTAREIDGRIAALTQSQADELAEKGSTVRLDRAAHRKDHLGEILALLE